MWEQHLRKDLHFNLKFHSGTVFSFCLCESTTWFLHKWNIDSKWVIPNGFINYNIYWLFNLKIKKLKLLLPIKIRYFLFCRCVKNLAYCNKFFSSSLLSTSPAIGMPKSVHVWPHLTMKFPPDFHNYTGLNRLVSFFS